MPILRITPAQLIAVMEKVQKDCAQTALDTRMGWSTTNNPFVNVPGLGISIT